MNELEKLKMAAEQYDYDTETGVFTHKKCFHKSRIGKRAGTWVKDTCKTHINYYNRLSLQINGKPCTVQGHRLAWFIAHGELPPEVIDHIEHATRKDDSLNRISNLREATTRLNCSNRVADSESKYLGVMRNGNNWQSRIYIKRKYIYLGTFSCEKFAGAVYQDAVFMLEKSGLDGVMEVKKRWVTPK